MENSRSTQTTDDNHLHLPGEIIHHIQSFLTAEEAAQTTVLSKSWYSSWLTRTTLEFDENHFHKPGCSQISGGFVSFVGKTLSRYEKSKLKIEKFVLSMNVVGHYLASLVSEWIVKVAGMGVEYMCIDIHSPDFMVVLPKEVLKAKSLKSLLVGGCKFSGDSEGSVMCFNLEMLSLYNVGVFASMIEDICMNCPLLEHVTLLDCEGLPEVVNVSKLLNLREVDVSMVHNPTELESTLIEFHDKTLGCVIGMSIFRTLTDLVLDRVKVDPAILVGLSVMFPCIKNLTIRKCYGCEVLDISSKSLEFLTCDGKFRVLKFDVPCIKKFKFIGDKFEGDIPLLSFTQCSKEWESHIYLTCLFADVSWFLELKIFLSSLRESKISLSLSILGHNDLVGHIQESSKPAVENLTLAYVPKYFSTDVCSQILYHLLRCFCPKFICQVHLPVSHYTMCGNTTCEEFWGSIYEDSMEDFTRRMVQHGTVMGLTTQGLPCCIEGLDRVDLEFFEEARAEWHPLPWLTFLDDLTIPSCRRKVRFRLNWKACASTGA